MINRPLKSSHRRKEVEKDCCYSLKHLPPYAGGYHQAGAFLEKFVSHLFVEVPEAGVAGFISDS
jgi:hypothetical protein